MKRIPIILALLLIALFPVLANDPDDVFGTIKGRVTTADGKPAASVTVILKGTKKAAVTEENGTFSIHHVKSGHYELEISQVGYETIVQPVQVDGNSITAVSIQLKLSSKELTEVVVTNNRNRYGVSSSDYASKMPLRNIENPQVYSSISKNLLSEQLIFSVDDALRNAPGVQKMWDATGRSGDGGSYYNMRGFIVQSTLRNGIAGNVSGLTDAANLEKLEVLKGPSATLFGNVLTSYGGLINRVTKKPYDHFGGEINYSTGSFEYNRFGVDLNTPLDSAKNVLLRVNAAYRSEGSFMDNGWNKGFVLAPSLSYKINDKLNFLIDAEFFSGQNTGLNVYFFPWGQTIAALGANRADQLNIDYKRSYASDDLYQTARNVNFFGQMNYTISNNWRSQTSFSVTNSFSDGPSPYFYLLSTGAAKGTNEVGNGYISRNDQYTNNSKDQVIELQQNFIGNFNLGSFRNRVVAGLDFTQHFSDQFFSGNTYDTIYALGNIDTYRNFNRTNMDKVYQDKGVSFVYPVNYIAKTYSAYISDVFNVTDNLMVQAALRLDHFDNDGPADNITGTYVNAIPYNQTFLSPKFGIVFQPIKDKISLFANYQNSFTNKYGSSDPNRDPNIKSNDFKPEQANQVEGGVKLDVLDGKLSTSVSVYNIKVTNVIRAGAGPNLFTVQDGTQVSKGVDAEVVASPFEGLSLLAGVAYNDSKYTKVADSTLDGMRPGESGSPWVANWWISYRLQCPALKGLGAGFGGNYASDNKIINSKSVGTFILPEYTVLNASIFYDQPKFRISVKMDNLTNQKYWIGYSSIIPQKLRNFGASVAFKF
ncbi:TonB-dependent receptor [Niastella vici]|uniref:TonB-dependent receptor n=1 Tax=Niastella vici TaxID=1703345 RepID=A0A1V9FN41_9BACT|nr:TonB-dependent receptor [Niastella vici]OQP59748.1 TonB-dependent receptor [Niastella vici]